MCLATVHTIKYSAVLLARLAFWILRFFSISLLMTPQLRWVPGLPAAKSGQELKRLVRLTFSE